MDVASLVASFADPKGLAALIDTVDRVVRGPERERLALDRAQQEQFAKARLERIGAQTERAAAFLGEEEFRKAASMLYFEDWLALAAVTSAGSRFASDFCLAGLLAMMREDPSTEHLLAVFGEMPESMKRRFIVWRRELGGVSSFSHDEMKQLEEWEILRTEGGESQIERILAMVAIPIFIVGGLAAVVAAVLIGTSVINWLYWQFVGDAPPDDTVYYEDMGPERLYSRTFHWGLWALVPLGLCIILAWIVGILIEAVDRIKPRALTPLGQNVDNLLKEIPLVQG